ncbi:hypothetical protein NA57DRAFT_74682 [Rhizodiscina lignyota]|uniref:Uncharacterized protein n=1 Tax=Rhizodiscina lignyota TaxID=1504668 RepID=A0A9P4IKT1_9PEZI|nr:hypothetical protein NA57DRAFT_74682 [Rhizodiscina lignyota]
MKVNFLNMALLAAFVPAVLAGPVATPTSPAPSLTELTDRSAPCRIQGSLCQEDNQCCTGQCTEPVPTYNWFFGVVIGGCL